MESHLLLDGVGHDDAGDETVDGQDLGHDGAESVGVLQSALDSPLARVSLGWKGRHH
jgi:hypothetical protein